MQDIYIDFLNDPNTFSISYKKSMGHYTMPMNHFHDKIELFYLLSGERFYFIKDRTFLVTKGDLVIIDAYDLHKTTDTGAPNHDRILIKFNKEFITPSNSSLDKILTPLLSFQVIRFSVQAQNFIEETLHKMLQEVQFKKTGFEFYLQAMLIQLLIFSSRYIETHSIDVHEHPSPIHQKISEIVQYINKNYSESITLSSVSKQFFISPYYLSRTFKKVTGFTFIEYLNSIRIKEAQKLLRESRLNASIIAEKVGFGSIAHFGRVFKTVTDQSPLHYRKLNRI
jgi:YesN/AraC family two-component response regulator